MSMFFFINPGREGYCSCRVCVCVCVCVCLSVCYHSSSFSVYTFNQRVVSESHEKNILMAQIVYMMYIIYRVMYVHVFSFVLAFETTYRAVTVKNMCSYSLNQSTEHILRKRSG